MTDSLSRIAIGALERYKARTGLDFGPLRAVLFDMDGVLYDSMPHHALAWEKMCREIGLSCTREEFFMYEGRTGASTIDILMQRERGRKATPEEAKEWYGIKTRNFEAMPLVEQMPGARECLDMLTGAGVPTVLVTGSGQASLVERLQRDFPGAFPDGRRVTGRDVLHGKPHPEPFLRGRTLAGNLPQQTVVAVDNAPLGVESASASGSLTIGVRTGPIPAGALIEAGADVELDSMEQCTNLLRELLSI